MRNRTQEQYLKISVFVITLVMIVLRFLLNEKGRVTPDSIRFMRQAHVFPEIDNTTAPLLYPLFIKVFTVFTDEFWSSKIVGILCYLFMVFFAWKKKFYWRESLLVGALFSMISLFAATLSETLFLPFLFVFFYVARNVLLEKYSKILSVFLLSLSVILLFNIRYSGLFFMGGLFAFGVLNYKKSFAKIYIISSIIGLIYVAGYKLFFIDVFNQNYVNKFLEIGLKPTSLLVKEFFLAIGTSFNPFIHILNPNGGILNVGILGIGFLNIAFFTFIFIKNKLSATEKMMVFLSVFGMICSFLIQYFYQTDALDYRLLAPFTFGIWLVYFKKLHQIFGKLVFAIAFLSLMTGFVISWLSRGNYLENRKLMKEFLVKEKLMDSKIYYYRPIKDENFSSSKISEIISTINPRVYITEKPEDSLKKEVLTKFKIESKVKMNKNKFQ